MNTQHTPGPWTEEREIYLGKLGEDPDRCCVEIHSSGRTIGYWYPCEWDGRCPDSRLISAAPELLAACEFARRELRGFLMCCGEDEIRDSFQGFEDAEQACIAAIAKATGREVRQ